MKLHASGEDYLETILVLQSPACAMQWLPCGTAAFLQWTKITFSI